ncbi:MAG: XylR family transcriptional regulator [Pirellulales bacterium]|nr:XylR family transcriptional regulator [Pirellulales bacterium]
MAAIKKTAHSNAATGSRDVLLALDWYYPEMHLGVARYAHEHRWHVTFDFDEPIPRRWSGDGVLTLLATRNQFWRQLRIMNVPIVDLAESRPKIPLPRVTMDNAAIARMAVEYFLDNGHRQFAFVYRRHGGVNRRRRFHFQKILAEYGYTGNVLSWQLERRQRADTRQQRKIWLVRRLAELPKPLAVLARDNDAVEVLEACLAAGFTVPDQVAVLGIDNTQTICNCLYISLSSIDPNLERVGYEGAALLDRLIRGEKAPETPIYITPRGIVERSSTDSLATNHPHVAAALKFMCDHAAEPIGMADIVQHVPISRSGLEKAFREHFVRSPIDQLRRIRLEMAKKMLRDTDDKLHRIARNTGFQNAHNLCRLFRKDVGMTPTQYRLAQ